MCLRRRIAVQRGCASQQKLNHASDLTHDVGRSTA
jgi:hypothetical protein